MLDVSQHGRRKPLRGSHHCLPAHGGEQAPVLWAAGLVSPHQPHCGMLSKMGSLAGSHGCLHRWTGQGRCHTAPCKHHPQEGVVGWAVGAADGSRDPPQHVQAVHPPRDMLGGCSHQASSHLVGSRSGKSCRKAFLHLFVQTGDLSVARDLGKRQSQWDATACARQLHSLCVAGLCYSSLWSLEASQGHLTCPRKGVIGSSERSALAPNCQHAH